MRPVHSKILTVYVVLGRPRNLRPYKCPFNSILLSSPWKIRWSKDKLVSKGRPCNRNHFGAMIDVTNLDPRSNFFSYETKGQLSAFKTRTSSIVFNFSIKIIVIDKNNFCNTTNTKGYFCPAFPSVLLCWCTGREMAWKFGNGAKGVHDET